MPSAIDPARRAKPAAAGTSLLCAAQTTATWAPTFAAAVNALIRYEAAGHQHIAVVSGYVGYYNILAPEPGGANPTITVFALKP